MRAVVVGAGYAAEGQVAAFRHLGVEMAAVCGRQTDVVEAFAQRLGIAQASTDWEATLRRVRPDIVCLATPAALREPVVRVACELGCDVFCDKPLAATVAEAERLLEMVEEAGIRHAFASTRMYDPNVQALATWLRAEPLGRLREVEVRLTSALVAPLPWSWVLDLAQGGGLLNNHFPHVMAILETVVGERVNWATGSAYFDIARAPVLEGLHDYRSHVERIEALSPDDIEALEHRPTDADTRYKASLTLGSVRVSVASGFDEAPTWAFRFESGELVARGELSPKALDQPSFPEPRPLPETGHELGDRYACLAGAMFGEGPYPTFADGLRTQRAIEAIRTGTLWAEPAQ